MTDSFARYLLAKQSVDDRALNKDVIAALRLHLSSKTPFVIEVGAGIGTMLDRMLRWEIITGGEYWLVDEMEENILFGREYIQSIAQNQGMRVEHIDEDTYILHADQRNLRVKFILADVFDFIEANPRPADLLIAHAFLDLLPLPQSLPKLFTLTKDLAWFTINFDGVSSLLPVVDSELDSTIEHLYHLSMDERTTGGNSKTGRRLFTYLHAEGSQILASGASDWIIYSQDSLYPADEAYFLKFILGFFKTSLQGHPQLNQEKFTNWLQKRFDQIDTGELVYIAHQIDFLVKP
jgi:hypothetical protein